MAREGINTGHPSTTVTTGGTGFGIASIVVGAERGFITRAAAAARLLQILDFLENDLTRYHGVWAHWNNGSTGATIAFAGAQDNGGDLVETAFLIEGMLIARQYFDDPNDPIETDVRANHAPMGRSRVGLVPAISRRAGAVLALVTELRLGG